MRDEAIALARTIADPVQRLNVLREYLQALVLRSLHESEAFQCLAFVGGTALRFVHQLPRFSEDLDFSLHESGAYKGEVWLGKVKRDLGFAGLDVMVSWNDRKTVHSAWIRIGGLLKPAGLGAMMDQKLSIKLEIDTQPPLGARTRNLVIDRHRLMAIHCYDLPSLMAGKLHAAITREYAKGRDWYDLIWYCTRVPPTEPNLTLLQNALDQTQGGGVMDASKWRGLVATRLSSLDVAAVREDVRPFLERQGDEALITRENIASVLRPVR